MMLFVCLEIIVGLFPYTTGVGVTVRDFDATFTYSRNAVGIGKNHSGSSLMATINALAIYTPSLSETSVETLLNIHRILIIILLLILYLVMFCTCHSREITRVLTTSNSFLEVLQNIYCAMRRSRQMWTIDLKPPGKYRTKWNCTSKASTQINLSINVTDIESNTSTESKDAIQNCNVLQNKQTLTNLTRAVQRHAKKRSMSHINYKPIVIYKPQITNFGGLVNRRVKLTETRQTKGQLSDQGTFTEGLCDCNEGRNVKDFHENVPSVQPEMLPIERNSEIGYNTYHEYSENTRVAINNESRDLKSTTSNGTNSGSQLNNESDHSSFFEASTHVSDDDIPAIHANNYQNENKEVDANNDSTDGPQHELSHTVECPRNFGLSSETGEIDIGHEVRTDSNCPIVQDNIQYQAHIDMVPDNSRENLISPIVHRPADTGTVHELDVSDCNTESTVTESSSLLKFARQDHTLVPYELSNSKRMTNVRYLDYNPTTQKEIYCPPKENGTMFKLTFSDINGLHTILKTESRKSDTCRPILMNKDYFMAVFVDKLHTESCLWFTSDSIDELPRSIPSNRMIVEVEGNTVSAAPTTNQNIIRTTSLWIDILLMASWQSRKWLVSFPLNDRKNPLRVIQQTLKFTGGNRYSIKEVDKISDCVTGLCNGICLTEDDMLAVQQILFCKHDDSDFNVDMFVPMTQATGLDSRTDSHVDVELMPKVLPVCLVMNTGKFYSELYSSLMDRSFKIYQQDRKHMLPILENVRAICLEGIPASITHNTINSVDLITTIDSLNNSIDAPYTSSNRFYDKFDSQQITDSSGYYTRDSSQSTHELLNITDESLNTLYSSTNNIPSMSVEESRITVDVEEDLDSNMDTLPDENMETSEYETQSRQIVTSVSRFETSTESYKSTNADNECIVTRRHCNTCTCPRSEYVAKVPNDMYKGEESLSNSDNISSEKYTNNVSSLDQNEETTSKSLISEFDNYETAASELSNETPIKLPVDLSISLIYEPSDIDLHCGSNREVCAPNDNTQMYSFYDGNSITHTTTEILHTSASSSQSNANHSEELSSNLHLCEQNESPSSDRCQSCRMLKIENIELKQCIRRILATHSDHNNIDDIYCPSINSDNPIGFLDENALDVFNLDTSSCDIFAREEESLQSSYDFRSTIFAPIKTCYDESNAENNHPPKFNSNDYLKREHNKTTLEEIQELNAALPLIPDIQNRFKKLTEYTWIKRIVSNGRFVRIKYDAMDHTNAVRFIKEATGMQSDQFECIYDAPKNI